MANSFPILIVPMALVLGSCQLAAQSSIETGKSLQGVWRIAEVTSSEGDELAVRNPQPSQIIFTKTHYSYMAVNQPRPKLVPPANPSKLTDSEKSCSLRALGSRDGTFRHDMSSGAVSPSGLPSPRMKL